ncbi:DUF7344 domain-containing protein [Salinigranum sp. GCM10025319]|uniref:DUF7344 domain-containing protein n=1 Tax=Salinigranum sp. GCM10025319 TaxID=3252687 RepID=UPI003611579A
MRDERFEALAHPIRQRVLLALRGDGEGEVTLAIPDDVADEGDADRLHLELYHVHLPRLQSAGFVAWDSTGGTVGRGARFDEVEPLLDALVGTR